MNFPLRKCCTIVIFSHVGVKTTEPHATERSRAGKHCWAQQSQGSLSPLFLLPVWRQQASSWLLPVASRKGSERALLKFALSINTWDVSWDQRLKRLSGRQYKQLAPLPKERSKRRVCSPHSDLLGAGRCSLREEPCHIFPLSLGPGKCSLIRQLHCPWETMNKWAN